MNSSLLIYDISQKIYFKKILSLLILILSVLLLFFALPAANQVNAQTNIVDNNCLRPDSAYIHIRKLLDNSLKNKDLKMAGLCYQQIGDIFYKEGVMPQALSYYHKADTYFTKETDLINCGSNLNRIGKIYFKNKRNSKALTHFREALKLFRSENHHNGIAESYGLLGQVFEQNGTHDSAYKYQELALSEFKNLKNINQIAYTYAHIGSIYEDKAEFQTALKYFLLAHKYYKKDTLSTELPAVLNNIGDTYRKIGNYNEALAYSKKAEILAVSLHDNRQISSAHRDLAKTFGLLGKFDSAFYYSEQARLAYAKSYNTDNAEQLNLIQTLFDVQHKDNEILILENKNRINCILTFCIFIIGILATFLGISLLSRQRLKIKNDKALYQTHQKALELKLHNKNLYQEGLKAELELRSKELTSHTLHIIKKNQILEELKHKLTAIVKDDKRDQRKELRQLVEIIEFNSNQDKNWEDFRAVFENVHELFFEKLKIRSASLTATDLRFLALLKMNLSSADIATMLAISQDSLRTTRYRLRKKLQLAEDDNLLSFVQNL